MAYQIHLPVQIHTPSGNGSAELAALYAERDRLRTRWEKGLNFLEDLRVRTGQDTPEFARWLAVWEQIDADLRRVLDRIECAEMTAQIKAQAVSTA